MLHLCSGNSITSRIYELAKKTPLLSQFETVDAVSLTTSRFVLGGEGAQQVASLCGMDVHSFLRRWNILMKGEGRCTGPWTTG